MRLPFLAAAYLLLRTTAAVFADEAWNVDYHYALLGQPGADTTFFHQPNANSKASLLYTLSGKGILGAVNPRDGKIVWRQSLSQNVSGESRGFLRAAEGQDVVVSGLGNEVAAWSAADGRLAWELTTQGPVEDVEILELEDKLVTAGIRDVLVLTSGDNPVVQRVNGASGAERWQYKIEGSEQPYQVSASATEIFVILLHKSMLGQHKIRVISIDPVVGHKTDEYSLTSDSELLFKDTLLSVGANSASPIIAWTDAAHTVLKVNIIGTKGISSFNIEKHNDKSVVKVSIGAPFQPNSLAHFLVHYESADSHWADVFHINLSKNKIEKAYSLPKLAGRGAFSTSVSDANVYFTRFSQGEIVTVSSSSHGVLGRWNVPDLSASGGAHENAMPLHAVSELSMKSGSVSAIRTAVLLTTGDWILLRNGGSVWSRPEALADILSVTFARSSAVEELAQQLETESHSNPIAAYIYRAQRHIAELRLLPGALLTLPQKFVRGFLGTSSDGRMTSDAFGFHQVVACATGNGRLMALDAGSPDRVLWSRRVVDVEAGEQWIPQLTSSADVIYLTQKPGDALESLAFNATTGQPLPRVDQTDVHVAGQTITYHFHDNGLSAQRRDSSDAGAIWHFMPSANEKVLSLVPRSVNDPVASVGKVLGDRRVLYKYLNPNIALLVTATTTVSSAPTTSNSATIYILDTITGSILYSTTHTSIDLTSPIASLMSENWFAYTVTTSATADSPKGHLLFVGEMFESLIPNVRAAANNETFSSGDPHVLTQTYHTPEPISKLAVTQTKQGITSRNLLAYLPASQALVGIPYNVLDPRRPVGRDSNKDEQAEGLVRYSPVIEFDARWYLNHAREVLGLKEVVVSPAEVESTSLLFAWGLDVFGTRVGPSGTFDVLGSDFNKFQMLSTVVGLFVGTVVVAPLVMRKGVDARWAFT